jgi:hypothetical protein
MPAFPTSSCSKLSRARCPGKTFNVKIIDYSDSLEVGKVGLPPLFSCYVAKHPLNPMHLFARSAPW